MIAENFGENLQMLKNLHTFKINWKSTERALKSTEIRKKISVYLVRHHPSWFSKS